MPRGNYPVSGRQCMRSDSDLWKDLHDEDLIEGNERVSGER
jgi:hypothetical protein